MKRSSLSSMNRSVETGVGIVVVVVTATTVIGVVASVVSGGAVVATAAPEVGGGSFVGVTEPVHAVAMRASVRNERRREVLLPVSMVHRNENCRPSALSHRLIAF
jgi:hypothetical protein